MITYLLRYRVWHRTTRCMVQAQARIQGRTRWGALRAWWRVQRQWQPTVEVQELRALHQYCPQTHVSPLTRGWCCAHVYAAHTA